MTSLVPPTVPPTIPVPRVLSLAWYRFPHKIKRSAAEILDRKSISAREDKGRSMREGMPDDDEEADLSALTWDEHWEAVRRQWTKGFPARTEEQKRRDPVAISLESTSKGRLVRYYEDVINSKGPFRKPVRLSHLMPILVAGWKDAGLWPTEDSLREAILEKGFDPDDYNLSVHLSSVLDSDAAPEKVDLAVNKILAKQNVGKPN